jgi:hypothetical protein
LTSPAGYNRLLKNTHLLLQRTAQHASFLVISRALHLNVFNQPGKFFSSNLLLCADRIAALISCPAFL